MHVSFRLPYLAGVLLLVGTSVATAESPLPDPIAPAVIGRPLDQIKPARSVRQKPAVPKSHRTKRVAASREAASTRRSALPAPVPAAVPQASSARQVAKQLPAHGADPRPQAAAGVATVRAVASRPFGPGAYFSSQDQALVRRYYETHPASARGGKWKIGDPVPASAALTGVPDDVRAALPALPPGHQYVQLDDEVVLVAVQSRTVVDGVSRNVR